MPKLVSKLEGVAERAAPLDVRDQLVALLGHDLRTPLASVLLGVQRVLRREQLDMVDASALMRVASSGHRMSRMVDQLDGVRDDDR